MIEFSSGVYQEIKLDRIKKQIWQGGVKLALVELKRYLY